jgi:DNA topoisomerase-1
MRLPETARSRPFARRLDRGPDDRVGSPVAAAADPLIAAKIAGLRYVGDAARGIRREVRGESVRYRDAGGRLLRDKAHLARIRSLAIPPGWTDVWICPHPDGHLQATGRDARGRKQYRYHPQWARVRDETKFDRMIAFGRALPRVRVRADEALSRPGLDREKVLATIVRLLELTLIRVGNEEYARQNESYGLTTLRNRHVQVTGDRVHFGFRGKSGVRHAIDLRDRRLARVVKRCRELPGYELFSYLDEEGQARSIDSSDVNAWLHEVAGEAFTAKDFRTWAGTMLAARALCAAEEFTSETEAKRRVVEAIATVSSRLGNTPAVCRRCYVHPGVIASYLAGELVPSLRGDLAADAAPGDEDLSSAERAVMKFLASRT